MSPEVTIKGIDLGPLPFESMESVGARLAWRNGKPLAQLVQEVRAKSGRTNWFGTVPGAPTDAGGLAYLCGWGEASERARSLVVRLKAEKYEWLHAGFRFCPICLEAGYHSYLFDWEFMHSCPLHGCLLTGECQSCGATIEWKKKERTLARFGYRCPKCECFLAGAETLLTEHLQLREQSDLIRSRMAPYEQIANRTIEGSSIVFRTWAALETMQSERLRPWCNAEHMRRVALYLRCHSNERAGVAHYRGVICLHWYFDLFTLAFACSDIHSNSPRALVHVQGTYRATARRLERWIFGSKGGALSARNRFREHPDELVGDWPVSELAFLMFRYVLEGHGGECTPAGEGRMQNFPLQMEYCYLDGRIFRLAARAYLLGLFATIHAILLQHRDWPIQAFF
jgi:hypothetical protein